MDFKIVASLISMIIFVIMASSPAFKMVKKLGVKDDDTSLIVRSLGVGVLTYLSMTVTY
jgi:hypothetical protein